MTKEDVGLAKALRHPVQKRSKASYERMLAAAEALLAERGNDEFTLLDVTHKGQVSIGSIYNRFKSKDALLHAVQLRTMENLDRMMLKKIGNARAAHSTLPSLIRALVEDFAETLRRFGPQMRPLMARAPTDALVASIGKTSYLGTSDAIQAALLDHREQIQAEDPVRAVDSAFRILYATIARYLGFGTNQTSSWEGDWEVLKQDLAQMIASYLLNAPIINSVDV